MLLPLPMLRRRTLSGSLLWSRPWGGWIRSTELEASLGCISRPLQEAERLPAIQRPLPALWQWRHSTFSPKITTLLISNNANLYHLPSNLHIRGSMQWLPFMSELLHSVFSVRLPPAVADNRRPPPTLYVKFYCMCIHNLFYTWQPLDHFQFGEISITMLWTLSRMSSGVWACVLLGHKPVYRISGAGLEAFLDNAEEICKRHGLAFPPSSSLWVPLVSNPHQDLSLNQRPSKMAVCCEFSFFQWLKEVKAIFFFCFLALGISLYQYRLKYFALPSWFFCPFLMDL